MKTPEEIKKGLEQCAETATCEHCHYRDDCMKVLKNTPLTKDALAYIQQLETDNDILIGSLEMWKSVACSPGAVEDMARENNRLNERLAQAERERDAALNAIHDVCSFCKGHCLEISGGYNLPECERCMLKNYRPENTEETHHV